MLEFRSPAPQHGKWLNAELIVLPATAVPLADAESSSALGCSYLKP